MKTSRVAFRLIAIRRDRQRRGHGTMLLRLAEERAISFGCQEVVLNAIKPALGFYRNVGFLDIGHAQTEFGAAPRMALVIS